MGEYESEDEREQQSKTKTPQRVTPSKSTYLESFQNNWQTDSYADRHRLNFNSSSGVVVDVGLFHRLRGVDVWSK